MYYAWTCCKIHNHRHGHAVKYTTIGMDNGYTIENIHAFRRIPKHRHRYTEKCTTVSQASQLTQRTILSQL